MKAYIETENITTSLYKNIQIVYITHIPLEPRLPNEKTCGKGMATFNTVFFRNQMKSDLAFRVLSPVNCKYQLRHNGINL